MQAILSLVANSRISAGHGWRHIKLTRAARATISDFSLGCIALTVVDSARPGAMGNTIARAKSSQSSAVTARSHSYYTPSRR